jgi:hypothetical protein
MIEEPHKVAFHPDATARFAELAQEVLSDIRSFPQVQPPQIHAPEIHPVARINAEDSISKVEVEPRSVNMLGEQNGHYWESRGLRVGWEGTQFEKIKTSAKDFEKAVKGRVSYEFLLKHILNCL